MAEDFSTAEMVIPGTYIRVRAEGLISVGGISTGNIGIVGTAINNNEATVDDPDPKPIDYTKTYIISSYQEAKKTFGTHDAYSNASGSLNLMRGMEQLFKNGASIVYVRALDPAGTKDYKAAFEELIKDDVNILVAPELGTGDATSLFGDLLGSAESNGKDMMAVVGCDNADNDGDLTAIKAQLTINPRIIMTVPGIKAYDPPTYDDVNKKWNDALQVTLSSTYSAAAMAGLLSSLTPQSSPTNKVLPGVSELSRRFSYGDLKDLTKNRFAVLEQRSGVRIVRGLTTDTGAFTQITTRRITDFAKAGIRKASDPFIGKLNNQRVRKALYGAIDGFLATMVGDEALTAYTLEVSATRADEIAGRAIVKATLQPTFSIDFIAVTLVLQ